jgi:DNA repair protein RecO (recombination protein O)
MSEGLSTRRVRVYPTDAIALKRMDFGEADRIITLLTPDHGKLRVIAKGVRRSTSRMAGHLELFSHGHLMIAKGRDLDVATQASTVEPFRELRESLVKASQAYHLAELVDGLLEDRDPHREVFQLLRDALAALNVDELSPDVIARHFEVQILALIGFQPQLSNCLECRTAIQPGANAYSTARGGVFCPSCAAREATANAIPVDTLKLLRYLQRTRAVQDVRIEIPGAIVKDAERILRRQAEFVLERRLRAADFVRRVAESAAVYTS